MVEVRVAEPGHLPAVVELLESVYVGEGYTPAARAAALTAALPAMDGLLVAVDAGSGGVIGAVVLLPAGSPHAQDAEPGEMEMRLLAVDPRARGRGAGAALVRACLELAGRQGALGLVLTTQPRMRAARDLYERFGFRRLPERDRPRIGGGTMLAYGYALDRGR